MNDTTTSPVITAISSVRTVITTSSSVITATSLVITTSSSVITAIPTANSVSSDNNNAGAVIGIVVGILCVLGLIVIILAVIYFSKRWYDKNRIAHQKFKDEIDPDGKYSSEGPVISLQAFENPVYEMN